MNALFDLAVRDGPALSVADLQQTWSPASGIDLSLYLAAAQTLAAHYKSIAEKIVGRSASWAKKIGYRLEFVLLKIDVLCPR